MPHTTVQHVLFLGYIAALLETLDSLYRLGEYGVPDSRPCLAEYVPPDVLVPKHRVGVDATNNGDEVVETGIEFSEVGGFEGVGFGPVGSALVGSDDAFKSG